jgi:DNA-binding NarL/FixJ family response regulator
MKSEEVIKVAIADDHQLFLKSLSVLIETFPNCKVVADALNGKEIIKRLAELDELPDILLLDVNMPELDGVQTARLLADVYPQLKMVALSMQADDRSILQMIRAGCCAYLLKDLHPTQLHNALRELFLTGYYNADIATIHHRRLLRVSPDNEKQLLNDRQMKFLQLACSDLTYKQIADKMVLSERTIDGYREEIFRIFGVQSRVGMVLEALRRKLVELNPSNNPA